MSYLNENIIEKLKDKAMKNEDFRKSMEELPRDISLYDLVEKFEEVEEKYGLPEMPRTEETEKLKYAIFHLFDHDPWFRHTIAKFMLVYTILTAQDHGPDSVEALLNYVMNLAMEIAASE